MERANVENKEQLVYMVNKHKTALNRDNGKRCVCK